MTTLAIITKLNISTVFFFARGWFDREATDSFVFPVWKGAKYSLSSVKQIANVYDIPHTCRISGASAGRGAGGSAPPPPPLPTTFWKINK